MRRAFRIRNLQSVAIVLSLGAALCLPPPAIAQAPDDVERNEAAKKALEEENLPEKYKAAEKIALDFLKGAAKNDSDMLVDVAITAASLGFPPAGIALGVMKALFFSMSTTPDPVVEAIKALDRRITAAENDISELQASVQQLHDKDLKIENRQRLRELSDRRGELKKLKNRLLERPQGQAAKSLIDDALSEANRFLADGEPDDDMWYWSDIRVHTDPATGRLRSSMLPKRFEPDVMLESYLQSLAIVIAAVEQGGYSASLRPQLERHVAFLTANPPGRDWPMPLPARMQGSITCDTRVPDLQYPDRDGVCRNTIVCDEAFPDAAGHYVGERRPFLSKRVEVPNVNLGDWCPKTMLSDVEPLIVDLGDRVGDAGILERTQVMALAAQALQGLGQLRDPKFDYTYFYPQYLYAVTAEGELVEYIHEIVEDRNPPKSSLEDLGIRERIEGQVHVRQPDLAATGIQERLSGPVVLDPAARAPSGAVEALRVIERDDPVFAKPQPVIRQRLVGPYPVDSGWGVYARAYPGGVYGQGAAVYAVTPAGDMNWYRHDNYRGGTDQWREPIRVGWGWNGYAKIFAAGDGVLYGVDGAGDLYWYRHLDAADTSTEPRWSGRLKVGNGWGHFLHIFSTGEGVVYAVQPDGRLLWYRHLGYQTGAPDWQGPKEVGTGWAHFRSLFSTGEGRIYAIQPNGDLYAYHHTGYGDGQPHWSPHLILGHGFDRFAYVFPAMWGTQPGPVVK